MASAELHRGLAEAVCIGEWIDIAIEPPSNQRIHERFKASDLEWLRGARVKYGAPFRVLDISAGGLLLETEKALKPNSNVVLELTGPDSPILIPSKVLRCRAASLGDILTYEGACAFKRPLTIPELTVKLARIPHNLQCPSLMRRRRVSAGGRSSHDSTTDVSCAAIRTTSIRPRRNCTCRPICETVNQRSFLLSQLKALFFVREFTGDPTRVEAKFFSETPHGRKMEVTFCDNESHGRIDAELSDRGSWVLPSAR